MSDLLAGRLPRLWSPSVMGPAALLLASAVVALSWLAPATAPGRTAVQPAVLLSLCLILATLAAYQFPIHIYPKTKIYMASVPFYLMAVLLPPALAATVAGLGALSGEVSVRSKRGSKAGQIATEIGRRMLVVLLGAMVAHLAGRIPLQALAWVGAAIVLAVGDVVTFPLVLAGVSADPPLRLIVATARQAYLMEGAQYLLGLLGALAATRQIWALALVVGPTVLVYLAFRALLQAASARHLAENAQHAAQEARRVAEQAVRVRDEFLTSASHDLRTPLTAMIGQIELMRMHLESEGAPNATWLHERIRAAATAGARMHAIVEEITDAAQLQMGHALSLHLAQLDMSALLRDVVASSFAATPLRGAAPVVVDDSAPIWLLGDRRRLERVLENVIGNAVKYTPSGVPVRVDAQQRDAWAIVTVRDQGVGIPADEVPHIFRHFYRASTNADVAGAGIGLAGVKSIVEQHGGHISVDSAVGRGTTVTLFLPRLPRTPQVVPEHVDAYRRG